MQQRIRYFLAGITLAAGFGVASAQPGGYEVIDLGTFTGGATDSTRAAALNDLGQVTGSAFTAANRAPHAFFYSGGMLTDMGNLRPDDPAGAYYSFGTDINNAGQVVGRADSGPNKFASFIADAGAPMTDIAKLGGVGFVNAFGVNSSGQVAGTVRASGVSNAAVWSVADGVTDLGNLGGNGVGLDLNDAGQVTGASSALSGAFNHAFLTGPGGVGMVDLGTLGGSFSQGTAVNSSGQVTGLSYTFGDGPTHAFFYSNGGMTDLGTLGGSFSEGMGLNDSGFVVGRAMTAGDAQQHAFVSGVNGVGLFDLNWFVSLDAGRFLTEAVGINRYGQIVANDNTGHAFLLSPVPEPQTWAMVLAALALIGAKTGGLRRRGTQAAQRKPNLRPKG